MIAKTLLIGIMHVSRRIIKKPFKSEIVVPQQQHNLYLL